MARIGEAACQLSSMFANVPLTRTTGYGWDALGRHEKLSAPGGGVVGANAVAVAPARKS